MNVCAKFRCAPLRTKKTLGIFRELITTTTRTTRVAFGDPPSGSKNCVSCYLNTVLYRNTSMVLTLVYPQRKGSAVCSAFPI